MKNITHPGTSAILRLIAVLTLVFVVMYVGYQQIAAQNLVTCPGLVQQAIDAVGNNCGSLSRNSACYGFQQVDAEFSQPQPVDFFTQPSDRARLLELERLDTSPMNQSLDHWGVALLSVQANLPDTLPGQSVIFMLLGDTQVENAVAPEDAFQTGTTINVTLKIGAQLYRDPSLTAQMVGSVPPETSLTADAISADGQWVRVAYQGMPGWLTQQVLTSDSDINSLPTIGQTPMQAFYFRTSISGTQCTEAPNSLVVQGPQDVAVDINANGADIRLGSTIALYLLPVDPMTQQYLTDQYGDIGMVTQLMQIIVLDGHVVLNEGTPDEIVLETGETSFVCLSEPENLGTDGENNDRHVFASCPWAPPRPVTEQDIEQFRELDGVTLNYPIDLPLELPTVTPMPTETPRPQQNYVYIAPAAATPTPTFTPQPQPQQQNNNNSQPQPTAVPPTAVPPTTNPCTDGFTFPTSVNDGDTATLIAAINAANDEVCHPGTDTIQLAGESSYTFNDYDNTTNGTNALPAITSGIIIQGSGSSLNIGDTIARLFYVAGGGNLSLNNVSLQGGYQTVSGGSVYNDGTLSITTGYVVNASSDVDGGALYNAGTATLNGVTLYFNSTQGNGGAIYNGGTLNASYVTLDNNNATAAGGGIYNASTFNLDHSAITNNTTSGSGGGLYNSGNASMVNSTVSNNGASSDGFGIFNTNATSLTFTTVYGNGTGGGVMLDMADNAMPGRSAKRANASMLAQSVGAGVASPSGTVTAKAVIIASNAFSNCSGTISAQGTNFSDDNSCAGFVGSSNLNINSTLDYNGGATQNHAIGASSDAIDTNDCTGVSDDQTGYGRPVDGNGTPSPGNECDAGSFEYDAGR